MRQTSKPFNCVWNQNVWTRSCSKSIVAYSHESVIKEGKRRPQPSVSLFTHAPLSTQSPFSSSMTLTGPTTLHFFWVIPIRSLSAWVCACVRRVDKDLLSIWARRTSKSRKFSLQGWEKAFAALFVNETFNILPYLMKKKMHIIYFFSERLFVIW